jgi:spore germination protein YaaH
MGAATIEHLFDLCQLPDGTDRDPDQRGLDIPRFGRFPMPMRRHRPLRRAALPVLAFLVAVSLLPVGSLLGAGTPARAAVEIRPRIPGIHPLTKEVYGYLPYWRMDSGTVDRLQYDLVSSIAFFGLGIKSSGALDKTWIGYKKYVSDDAAAITNAAHDRGVRVVPTFQLFDSNSADGYPKMTKFLKSPAAQDRFIQQALDLMAARQADGAGLDFEPVRALNSLGKYYVPFVQKFRAAMKARFPDSTLVNALSAGGSERIIKGLVGVVDHQMVMTYNYRWKGSTITGAIAPLAHATRNIQIHIDRILQWAPAKQLLLGVPYYGYNWPVKTNTPNATVKTPRGDYGGVFSVTYASARNWLKAHKATKVQYDALEGSAFYTYKSVKYKVWRQVYFDNARSIGAKYDYAIVKGLGGVGIWTLDNDRGYTALWDVIRKKFYDPIRKIQVTGSVLTVRRSEGIVTARVRLYARELGTVPERGIWKWTIRDPSGTLLRSGSLSKQTLYPGRKRTQHTVAVSMGSGVSLRAGTYTLRVRFITVRKTWRSTPVEFHQPY